MLGGKDQPLAVFILTSMTAVWKRFVTNGFLRDETSLALQFNLDWPEQHQCWGDLPIHFEPASRRLVQT